MEKATSEAKQSAEVLHLVRALHYVEAQIDCLLFCLPLLFVWEEAVDKRKRCTKMECLVNEDCF